MIQNQNSDLSSQDYEIVSQMFDFVSHHFDLVKMLTYYEYFLFSLYVTFLMEMCLGNSWTTWVLPPLIHNKPVQRLLTFLGKPKLPQTFRTDFDWFKHISHVHSNVSVNIFTFTCRLSCWKMYCIPTDLWLMMTRHDVTHDLRSTKCYLNKWHTVYAIHEMSFVLEFNMSTLYADDL